MLKWTPYPFVRFTAALILGILTGDKFPALNVMYLAVIIMFLCIIYAIAAWFLKRELFFRYNPLAGTLALSILFLTGFFSCASVHQSIIRHSLQFTESDIQYYSAWITNQPVLKNQRHRFEVKITKYYCSDGWMSSDIKAFIYLKAEPDTPEVRYGDRLFIKGNPQAIHPPPNAYTFDYRKWMYRQRIQYQDYLSGGEVIKYGNQPPSRLIAFSIMVRDHIAHLIAEYFEDDNTKGVVSALLIGQRDYLDPEIAADYSRAGVFHILAVSGLHVGILYFILVFLFGWLNKKASGRWIFAILVMIFLLAYVLVTGMSPSVKRAATMLSLIPVSKAINRRANIYNTIAFSAFVHLLLDPFLLYSAGFQLSYLAVLGIVIFFNPVYNLIEFNLILIDRIWKLWSVSLAAQIITFPITLYYFNQFPVVFLLSNLVMIPAAFITVVLGFSIVILQLFPFLCNFISAIIHWILQKSAVFIHQLNLLQGDLFSSIHVSRFEMFLLYGMILGFTALFMNRRFKFALFTFILIIFFSLNRIRWLDENMHKNRLIVYNTSGAQAIELARASKGTVFFGKKSYEKEYIVKNLIKPVARNQGRDIYLATDKKEDIETSRIERPGYDLYIWQGKVIAWLTEPYKLGMIPNKLNVHTLIIDDFPDKYSLRIFRHFKADNLVITGRVNMDGKTALDSLFRNDTIQIYPVKSNDFIEIFF